MRNLIRWFLVSIDAHFLAVGINLRNLLNAAPRLPSYWRDFLMFTKDREFKGQWPISMYPVLIDKHLNAGQLGEYFWQDLFVAKHIIKLSPRRHIDVGSRIDGFVAHLACVRKVEVFDIRPLAHQIENVDFVQWDITNPNASFEGCADCVSCLHTLEHIGLGRYGDRLDADGWRKGLKSLIGLLEYGGYFGFRCRLGCKELNLMRTGFSTLKLLLMPHTTSAACSNVSFIFQNQGSASHLILLKTFVCFRA